MNSSYTEVIQFDENSKNSAKKSDCSSDTSELIKNVIEEKKKKESQQILETYPSRTINNYIEDDDDEFNELITQIQQE